MEIVDDSSLGFKRTVKGEKQLTDYSKAPLTQTLAKSRRVSPQLVSILVPGEEITGTFVILKLAEQTENSESWVLITSKSTFTTYHEAHAF